jgi:molecular chaperone HtpG
VAKGEIDLEATDDAATRGAERAEQERDFSALLDWLRETLADHVSEVRLSTRLTESPACLITPVFGITPSLARMYRASGQEIPQGKRILEINARHPLISALHRAHRDHSAAPSSSETLAETAELLYGTALLAEGGELEDPVKFAALLTDRLVRTV